MSLITVLWVGKILHRNGRDFLFEGCPDHALSEASNNLLYAGYCLVNAGFAFYFIDTCETFTTLNDVLEFIGHSEGIIFSTLGVAHFLNMLFVPKLILLFFNKRNINPPRTNRGIN